MRIVGLINKQEQDELHIQKSYFLCNVGVLLE